MEYLILRNPFYAVMVFVLLSAWKVRWNKQKKNVPRNKWSGTLMLCFFLFFSFFRALEYRVLLDIDRAWAWSNIFFFPQSHPWTVYLPALITLLSSAKLFLHPPDSMYFSGASCSSCNLYTFLAQPDGEEVEVGRGSGWQKGMAA